MYSDIELSELLDICVHKLTYVASNAQLLEDIQYISSLLYIAIRGDLIARKEHKKLDKLYNKYEVENGNNK